MPNEAGSASQCLERVTKLFIRTENRDMRVGVTKIRAHVNVRDADQSEPRIVEIAQHDLADLLAQKLADLLLSPCSHCIATFLGRSATRPRQDGAWTDLERSGDLFRMIELELIPNLNIREASKCHATFVAGLHFAYIIFEALHRRDHAIVYDSATA